MVTVLVTVLIQLSSRPRDVFQQLSFIPELTIVGNVKVGGFYFMRALTTAFAFNCFKSQ